MPSMPQALYKYFYLISTSLSMVDISFPSRDSEDLICVPGHTVTRLGRPNACTSPHKFCLQYTG